MFRRFEGPTADHVWQQMAQAFRESEQVRQQPSRGGETREMLHAAICIEDPTQRWVTSRHPTLNVAFAIAEVASIMTGRRDLAFLEAWNTRLPKFVGPGPHLHGAYGYRLRRHLGMDQIVRAYEALSLNPRTRQVALQIWDSSIDLPLSDGQPADQDVPCSMMSLLKVRDGRLEWLQIMRSNDLFLGVPHDFVQFTCLQEIMAGWLNIGCAAYHQVSDSLHAYERDGEKLVACDPLPQAPRNTDSLALPRDLSESLFSEMGAKIEQMIEPDLSRHKLEAICVWNGAPQAFRNLLAVLVAEAARRHKWPDLAARVMSACTNPVYLRLWDSWVARVGLR